MYNEWYNMSIHQQPLSNDTYQARLKHMYSRDGHIWLISNGVERLKKSNQGSLHHEYSKALPIIVNERFTFHSLDPIKNAAPVFLFVQHDMEIIYGLLNEISVYTIPTVGVSLSTGPAFEVLNATTFDLNKNINVAGVQWCQICQWGAWSQRYCYS